MDESNVALTISLDEEHLRQIADVSPWIRVWDVAHQVGVEAREGRPPGLIRYTSQREYTFAGGKV